MVVPRISYCSNGFDAALLDYAVLKNNLQYFSIASSSAIGACKAAVCIFIDFKPVFTNYEGITIPPYLNYEGMAIPPHPNYEGMTIPPHPNYEGMTIPS